MFCVLACCYCVAVYLQGANVNAVDRFGNTPLQVSCCLVFFHPCLSFPDFFLTSFLFFSIHSLFLFLLFVSFCCFVVCCVCVFVCFLCVFLFFFFVFVLWCVVCVCVCVFVCVKHIWFVWLFVGCVVSCGGAVLAAPSSPLFFVDDGTFCVCL